MHGSVSLLTSIGDDPLEELIMMDDFYKWSYRINLLEGTMSRKRRDPWMTMSAVQALIIILLLFTITALLIGWVV